MLRLDPAALVRIVATLDSHGGGPADDRAAVAALALWLGAAERRTGLVEPARLVAAALAPPERRRLAHELRRVGVGGRLTFRRRVARAVRHDGAAARRVVVNACLGRPERRLAVYGTLAPGGPNHDLLAGLGGRWERGSVEGEIVRVGWGEDRRLRALVPRRGAGCAAVWLLEADGLTGRWAALDDFEGPAYRRALVVVQPEGLRPPRVAHAYVLGLPTAPGQEPG